MRLKIVIAAGLLLDGRPSGASRRLLEMLDATVDLLEPGESITALHRRGHLPADATRGVEWHAVDVDTSTTWRRLRAERRLLPRVLRELGADVVEIGALPVPPRLPCPVALTIHDLRDFHGLRRRRTPRFVLDQVLRNSLRRATTITVPSEATAADLRAVVGHRCPEPFVVYGGVRPPAERPNPEPWPRPYLLHVGHLEERKNLLMLLSAFAELLQQIPAAEPPPQLLLVGQDGGSAAQLHERVALLELAEHVRFLHDVDDERLQRLLVGARAVLVPSLLEGFGQPVLEALVLGRPCLVSDRGALAEIGGDAVVELSAEDAAAWTTAMRRELERDPGQDPDAMQRRLDRARAFPWSETAATQLAVWRTAAGSL